MAEPVVHVVDDDEAARDSLGFLLESDGHAVRAHPSAPAFLLRIGPGAVGCVVTDVRVPQFAGLDLLRALRKRGLRLPVIVITGHGDLPLAVQATNEGAFDFLEKPFEDEELLSSVRRALQEATTVADDADWVRGRLAELSAEDLRILKRLIEGQPNRALGLEMGKSAYEVEVRRARLMTQMGATSFADLVRLVEVAGGVDE